MKNILQKIFKRQKSKYEVWDTSALSNHFEKFKQTLQNDDSTILVVPEGVSHEISVGRRTNKICEEIYRFIEGNVRNPRLIVHVTPDSIRAWAVDEQVIYTANKYKKAVLVTCDRDQSFRARLKKIDTQLLPVLPHKETKENVKKPETVVLKVEPKKEIIVEQKEFPEGIEELELPVKKMGKQIFLARDPKVSLYDRKGKRKFYKGDSVVVNRDDTVRYKDVPYMIKKIGDYTITLKKSSI